MKKTNQNLNDEPITKKFFVDYMNDFSAKIARGFSDERDNMNTKFIEVDKRFEQVDKRFDKIESRISMETSSIRSETKNGFEKFNEKIDKLDQKIEYYNKQRMIDDEAIFGDLDIATKRIFKIEKKVFN